MTAVAFRLPPPFAWTGLMARVPRPAPSAWAYAARTVLAALLALWLAFGLELDTPYSAATTVLIVAHPVQGAILSKSLYRLGGTLVGAVVAVALMAGFAQAPELFLLGFGLWMGLCTAASTLLRSFRSYGAVLAGYTVALIAMPGVAHPESVFDLAAARVAVVSLGIGSSAVVAAFLTNRSAEATLEARVRATLAELSDYCRMALSGAHPQPLREARRRLAARIGALETLVEFAAVETATLGPLADSLKGGIAAMFGTLTAATALHSTWERQSIPPAATRLARGFACLLAVGRRRLAEGGSVELDRLTGRLAALGGRVEGAMTPAEMNGLVALDRLDEVVDEFTLCLDALASLVGRRPGLRPLAALPHRDVAWAATNGLRAAIAVWLASALWVATAWPAGPMMVACIVPNVGLLSLRDRPAADALGFVWGIAIASVVGFFFLLWVLPQITGFPLLAMWLGAVLVVAVAGSTLPQLTFVSLGFCVFFITLLAPSNPMQYDPEAFLNNALATLSGAALTAVVYRFVLPVDAKAHKRRLMRAIVDDLRVLLRGARPVDPAAWEARMHDRLLQLGARLRAAGMGADLVLRGGFAALRIGREVLRVRTLLAADPAALALAERSFASLIQPKLALAARVHACHEAADGLTALAADPDRPQRAAVGRAAAGVLEVAFLYGRNRRFFPPQRRR